MSDLNQRTQDLLSRIPDSQRQAASALLAQYGPRLFEMAQEDVWQYLRRLLAGDIEALAELDSRLSPDEFVAKVKVNTARWEAVANYNKVRDDVRREILLRLAPVAASVLIALVGL